MGEKLLVDRATSVMNAELERNDGMSVCDSVSICE